MFKLTSLRLEYDLKDKSVQFNETGNNNWLIKLVSILFNGFIITPIVIIYWAAGWDIIFLYIYPDFFELSCLVTFVTSKVAMLIFYLIQEFAQNFYDSIDKFGQQRLIFKIILFFFKTIYVNMISFASLLQYRSYWDFYNESSTNIDYRFFFAISIITILAYRYLVDGDFTMMHCQIVPFQLLIDADFNYCCLLQSPIKAKNKWVQRVANYFYMEWFETLINVIIWKGIYDLMDIGTQQLFYNVQPNTNEEFWISIIFTTVFSYSIFFCMYLLEKTVRTKSKFIFGAYTIYFFDFIDLIVYLAMIGIWRVFWQGFDIIAFDKRFFKTDQESGYFVLSSFVACIIICSILGLNANLFATASLPEAITFMNNDKNKSYSKNKSADTSTSDYVVSSSI